MNKRTNGLEGKKCFSICTSTTGSEKYTLYPKEAIEKKRRNSTAF